MNLQETIKKELQEAMKAKDEMVLSVLRNIMSEITNENVRQKKKPNEPMGDEGVLAVIKRLAKQRNESITQFRTGGREDLAEIEEKELVILDNYLPELMSKEAVEKVVEVKIQELNITEPSKKGVLIGAVMKELAGKADGKIVSEVVNEKLS